MFILPLTNFHIPVEAVVTPKNVPEKRDLWMQKYHQRSPDIASSQEEKHRFENKVIT